MRTDPPLPRMHYELIVAVGRGRGERLQTLGRAEQHTGRSSAPDIRQLLTTCATYKLTVCSGCTYTREGLFLDLCTPFFRSGKSAFESEN
jgi:hypothetical protein